MPMNYISMKKLPPRLRPYVYQSGYVLVSALPFILSFYVPPKPMFTFIKAYSASLPHPETVLDSLCEIT